MRYLRFLLMAIAAGSTLLATGATFAKFGVPEVQHPKGINLRQESVKRRHPGMLYTGRGHYGGGIRSHK